MLKALLIRVVAVSALVTVLLFGAEIFLRLQHFVQLDHFHDKSPWSRVLHHGKDNFVVKDYGLYSNGKRIKVLLLGDSWMEDPNLSGAIGEEFAERTDTPLRVINGGNTSYAPTLYLLKARQAYQRFGKFDYIIVNIDETDIGDEWLRYKIPTVRDKMGKITAVSYNRDIYNEYLWNGKLWAEHSDFYVVRLLKFAFYYKILVPMFYKLTFCPDYSSLMRYVFAPDARSAYEKECRYFDDRLLEMAKEISTFTTDQRFVYVTHHPHRRGLVDKTEDGQLYLPVVSEAIARLKEKCGVSVLDARNFARQIHGEGFPENTYEPGDPFSHLSSGGAIRYGKWIADQISLKKN